jgi:hypothetical protein
MSKAEILAALPKLTPEERAEVCAKLAELDGAEWLDDGELSDAEKALVLTRLEECERNPKACIRWDEAEARLKARFGS